MAVTSKTTATFVTAANEKYFFLCGILLQSLEHFFPGLKCLVMDIGLSKPQKDFFSAKGALLPMPPGLSETDHPYKLKSSMGLFLDARIEGTPIWIDSDMMAVSSGEDDLLAVLKTGHAGKKIFAIAPDDGVKTVGDFSVFFPAPKLWGLLHSHSKLRTKRYLNAGIVMFFDRAVLNEWRELSSALENDHCWEQNALNMIGHRDDGRLDVLDARVWNVHAELIKKVTMKGDAVYCDEQKSIFVHAASGLSDNLQASITEVSTNGHKAKGFLREFKNEGLRQIQQRFLEKFIITNAAALRNAGVLQRPPDHLPSLDRNSPCYCGSGKRLKHCHGV